MLDLFSPQFRSGARAAGASVAILLALSPAGLGSADSNEGPAQQITSGSAGTLQKTNERAAPQRIPRQQALTTAAVDGVVREAASSNESRPVAAELALHNLQSGKVERANSNAEGVFRILSLAPGHYEFRVDAEGFATFTIADLALNANEVTTLEISLVRTNGAPLAAGLPRLPELGTPLPAGAPPVAGSYRELRHRLDSDPKYIAELAPEYLPPVADIYSVVPNRWALSQPDYRRYAQKGEYQYTKPHWYDPFNRNRFKGDEPIWPERLGQQIFLDFTATSETFYDGRRVPSPSGVTTDFWCGRSRSTARGRRSSAAIAMCPLRMTTTRGWRNCCCRARIS